MRRARVSTAAFLFGIGLGGLLEGIVLREMLHWQPPGAASAWLDLALWLAVAVGAVFLLSAFRAPGRMPSERGFAACVLMGWGGFNVMQGIVGRWILDLDHVRQLPSFMEAYDWGLLGLSVLVFLVGWSLRDPRDPYPLTDRRSGTDRRLGSMLPH
jgi:uncharacterized membrane protein